MFWWGNKDKRPSNLFSDAQRPLSALEGLIVSLLQFEESEHVLRRRRKNKNNQYVHGKRSSVHSLHDTQDTLKILISRACMNEKRASKLTHNVASIIHTHTHNAYLSF